MIITPIVERLIENERKKRLALLFPCKEDSQDAKSAGLKHYKLTPQQVLLFQYAENDRLCSVGINVLDRHYQDDDVVDISSLKKKKLIRERSERLRIISVGALSKRLTVCAHSCTDKAYKAIVKAGGALKLLRDESQDSEEGNND